MTVSRLTLSDLLGISPGSSNFKGLVATSRFFGLTTGGVNSAEFGLTSLGSDAMGNDDESKRVSALKEAVWKVDPYRMFLETFSGKKVPSSSAFKEFLVTQSAVPAERGEECMEYILADARTAGFIRSVQGAEYIDLEGVPAEASASTGEPEGDEPEKVGPPDSEEMNEGESEDPSANGAGELQKEPLEKMRPKAIFVGGRKSKSLNQLTKILDEYKIPYKLAEDEPHGGRPISQKVAETMRECGAAILIFTPDIELRDLEENPVWRPTENVVHELGAASMEYGNRIVIFREERIDLASNYGDIGHIVFKEGELAARAVELFRELINFGLVEISVPARSA